MARVPLAVKSDPARSTNMGAERLVNLFPETIEAGGKSRFGLYATPGLTTFSAPSEAPCRGEFALDDELTTLHEQTFYKINSAGVATFVGSVPGLDRVIMARNDKKPNAQLAIVCDAGLYVYTKGGAVLRVSTEDLDGTITSVEFLDGYLILTMEDGRYFWTAINEATSVDGLDFNSAEGSPDGLLRAIRYKRQIALFGPESVEFHVNTGDAEAPFQRLPGAVADVGIISRYAAVTVAEKLFWIDHLGIMRRLDNGYQATRVSNFGLEKAIEETLDKSQIAMFGHVKKGHEFVVITSPSFTWVYDAMLGVAHERKSYGIPSWQAIAGVQIFGKFIVGSSQGGKLFELDEDRFDEDGNFLVSEAVLPIIANFPNGGVIPRISFDVEAGVGAFPPGRDEDITPSLMMQLSKDGGKSWGPQRIAPLGKKGNYRERVDFFLNGEFGRQGLMIKIGVSDRVPRNVLDCDIQVIERAQ